VTVKIEANNITAPNIGLFDRPDSIAVILAGPIIIPIPANSIIINMIEVIVSLSILG
jgi:hypothetical protein